MHRDKRLLSPAAMTFLNSGRRIPSWLSTGCDCFSRLRFHWCNRLVTSLAAVFSIGSIVEMRCALMRA